MAESIEENQNAIFHVQEHTCVHGVVGGLPRLRDRSDENAPRRPVLLLAGGRAGRNVGLCACVVWGRRCRAVTVRVKLCAVLSVKPGRVECG